MKLINSIWHIWTLHFTSEHRILHDPR